ncbi:hypothetical protein VEZ01S_17_00170 [Vibrio ezurae NBRC 102218]|uniref:Uncharacterized protein n=1 Tax=Vibrio ezurae NBRC 102218 TaxID=1219080 RepID=U3B0M4_9VIBR|nr:hypothetical protein VEZ01S_17_00170 [Vibrio ezurae NBRC 102218]
MRKDIGANTGDYSLKRIQTLFISGLPLIMNIARTFNLEELPIAFHDAFNELENQEITINDDKRTYYHLLET